MCDKSAFRELKETIPLPKTAEQIYKEWWEKRQEKIDEGKYAALQEDYMR
jgi:hypothetical protein